MNSVTQFFASLKAHAARGVGLTGNDRAQLEKLRAPLDLRLQESLVECERIETRIRATEGHIRSLATKADQETSPTLRQIATARIQSTLKHLDAEAGRAFRLIQREEEFREAIHQIERVLEAEGRVSVDEYDELGIRLEEAMAKENESTRAREDVRATMLGTQGTTSENPSPKAPTAPELFHNSPRNTASLTDDEKTRLAALLGNRTPVPPHVSEDRINPLARGVHTASGPESDRAPILPKAPIAQGHLTAPSITHSTANAEAP